MSKRRYLVIGLIVGIALIAGCSQQEDDTNSINGEFREIEECITGVHVDYRSGITVRHEADVELAFNDFISWAQENDEDIFGYGNKWRYENTAIHGFYEGTKYWKVTASWFSEEDQEWRNKNVFDVSENGEVVRLLGCI